MSETGSWVLRLRPTVAPEILVHTCSTQTWERTVERIGRGPALWAVELSREHVLLAVEPDLRGVRRTEAAHRLQPTTEAVNMRALVALAEGAPTPTTPTAEMLQQLASAVRRRVPLEHVLELAHASHARFGEALLEQFRRLVPPAEQSLEMSQLSRFLVDHVSAFALACSTAYVAAQEAWLAGVEGARGEFVRSLLRGEDPEPHGAQALRYELATRTHIGFVLQHVGPGEPGTAALERRASELLSELGATGTLVVAGDDEVWAWAAFADASSAARTVVPDVPDLLVGVGAAAHGLDGFRSTHDDARSAVHVARLGPVDAQIPRAVLYHDVRLLALLVADPERAARFARDELGALAGERESVLRTTVRAYLECGGSPATAAAVLHVAKNTVVYRVQRAEELLGRSVKEQQGMLWAALHLLQWIDSERLADL